MKVRRVFTGAPWEQKAAYCRALRAGSQIYVSGTAPVDTDGSTHAPGDGYAQAIRCLEIVGASLARLGAEMKHITRTRMFVTDIHRWQEFARAHHEVFGDHPPATTMVEVSRLIAPDMLIEIEVDAVCPPPSAKDGA